MVGFICFVLGAAFSMYLCGWLIGRAFNRATCGRLNWRKPMNIHGTQYHILTGPEYCHHVLKMEKHEYE